LAWLVDYSGWFTHLSGHPSATGRAQDKEISSAKDRRYTIVPRDQPARRAAGHPTVDDVPSSR